MKMEQQEFNAFQDLEKTIENLYLAMVDFIDATEKSKYAKESFTILMNIRYDKIKNLIEYEKVKENNLNP